MHRGPLGCLGASPARAEISWLSRPSQEPNPYFVFLSRRACVLAGDERSQLAALECAEQTGALMYGLARHSLNAAALKPSASDAKPLAAAARRTPSSSHPAKGLVAFVNQIAGELRCPQSQYGGLGAAMAVEACVAAAAAALGAASGAAHRNPYHEILAGGASHQSLLSPLLIKSLVGNLCLNRTTLLST